MILRRTQIKTNRIIQYIQSLREIDIIKIINRLPSPKLKILIKQAESDVKKYNFSLNQSSVIQQMIHLQLNTTIGKITDKEKIFLKSHNINFSMHTYVKHITEYRHKIKKLLDNRYISCQKKYKIRYKKLKNIINQQCLDINEFEISIKNIKKDFQLIKITNQIRDIQQGNQISRIAEIALVKMTADKIIYDQINQQSEETKKKRQEEYKLINANKYIRIAEQLLNSNNYHELILAICALTGRRQIEVVKTGKFKINRDYTITFTGQVKKTAEEDLIYIIPVLCSPQKIIKAHKRLKKLIQDQGIYCSRDSNKSINNRLFTSTKNSKLKQQIFQSIFPFGHSETKLSLRAAYTRICYDIFQPDMSFVAYAAAILNHQNMDSAASYDQYKSH